MANIRRILMASDFSGCSKEAFDYAVHLSKRLGADLYLLHVFEPPFYPPSGESLQVPPSIHQWITTLKKNASDNLHALTEEAKKSDIKIHSIFKDGAPYEVILETAKEVGADLIVIGNHGRAGLDYFLMGSVAESVLRKASCPVFLVRSGAADAPATERGQ